MKIDGNINLFLLQNNSEKDVFDLDIKMSKKAIDEKIGNQLITSKSLCTPTCGNTGSNNSFCC
jgi:gallidermin/nisin family lantibiotic